MTEMVSLAKTVLDPSTACRTVSASINGTCDLVGNTVSATVRKTKDVVRRTHAVAVDGVWLVSRPILWPINLSVDLSRRVSLQVLITLREVLVMLNDLVTIIEKQLSEQDKAALKETPTARSHLRIKAIAFSKNEDEQSPTEEEDDYEDIDECEDERALSSSSSSSPSCDQEITAVSCDRALDAWKHQVAMSRKLEQTNAMLKRRLMVTENKYEMINAQVIALKDLYQDKMADMEYDVCDLKKQRLHVMSMIESAQMLAQDCHGDVQKLMDDVYRIAMAKGDDGLSTPGSLSLDLSLEGLTLMSQQKDLQLHTDSDTGFMDGDTESDTGSLALRRLLHHACADLSTTSSLTSLDTTAC